ncbi:hypothetical protein Phum_PHUM070630 [Pediculus humanus corporis]|uniref:Uncharacterized protein n=1 Tax=Pediculus humanus subsp. corporis TaxID=121224 RepID=E0VBT6_PEDHC|nr:uncharacterized protein Phum_PHUM070630 [Pediculus humanus corporis]EEB10842.1 hypothetical protein Phum_PHUM070630 [Pediculus humanus corporis]
MYPGFVGTVLSHFFSLLSTVWSIFIIHSCSYSLKNLYYIRFAFLLLAANSSLGLVRYGSSDGYKLRRLHIISLNVSIILYFTIVEVTFLHMIQSWWPLFYIPALNIFPLIYNAMAKDYRTNENYYGMAFCLSYAFGYFIIGESGYFLDTELPSVDAFQYLTCFLNYFAAFTLCN